MNKDISMGERRQLMESVRGLIYHLNREEVNAIAVVLNSCCERLLKEAGEEIEAETEAEENIKQF